MSRSEPKLVPVAGEPGVWRRPSYLPGDAGTFAFVVGVSDYTHLDGTDESLTLRKLHVSALTAYRFFQYLVNEYDFADAPLAECVLLLAPTAEEQAIFQKDALYPVNSLTAPAPEFLTLFTALQRWRGRLRPPVFSSTADHKSRTMFFFSGHGLEIDVDEQLLLPSDYLSTPDYNNAINTLGMYRGMACVPILDQFYFIDACRNDIIALHNLSAVDGISPLTAERSPRYPRAAPIMHATTSGDYAFQPPSPGPDGTALSFFGGAVLDALRVTATARPVFEPDCTVPPCSVNVVPLYTYVNKAVTLRLQAEGRGENAPVVASGVVDRVISHVAGHEAPPKPLPDSPVRKGVAAIENFFTGAVESILSPATFIDAAPVRGGDSAAPRDRTYELHRTPISASSFAWPGDVTGFINGLRTFAWYGSGRREGGGSWSPADDAPLAVRADVVSGGHRAILHFTFDRNDMWRWMESRTGDRAFAFLLPASRSERPVFTLEFALAKSSSGGVQEVTDVRCNLSELNDGALRVAAQLWTANRETSAAFAVERVLQTAESAAHHGGVASDLSDEGGEPGAPSVFDIAKAMDLLFGKSDSPLAATVGALVLRRAGSTGELALRWLVNLARNYGETSDAAILALEQRAAFEEAPGIDETQKLFRIAYDLGTPCTADATGILLRLLRFAINANSSDDYPEDYRSAMLGSGFLDMYAPLLKEYASFRPGGLFTSFGGRTNEMPRIRNRIA